MSIPIVRLGDVTSHGGSVVSASPTHRIGGLGIARMGDQVSCPIPGHGVNIILEGATTYLIAGRMVALQGHKCACGCALISSLATASYG
nr:PAAR domain-containing protein [uncultured Duganella sp.]